MNKQTNGQPLSTKTRGEAMRASRRNNDDAEKRLTPYTTKTEMPPKPAPTTNDGITLTFLGGLDDVGEKNMAILEYQNDAIVLDCGNHLGIDLPGINYAVNDITYLRSIRHKVKAYVITHGHLDHIGGLKHIVPEVPAPIYSSAYSIGVIERSFADESTAIEGFSPDLQIVNMDVGEQIKIGSFRVEFIRVTHSIPDPSAVCIYTPVGNIVATGDFRLDPEPLDKKPVDVKRLTKIGDEGVLLLMSDSSYADAPGRTPTEDTLQQTYLDIITHADGRIFVALFSSNINRIQMIINAAVASGRKVALDGRSMLGYAEIAVRQGILSIPKGTIIPMSAVANIKDGRVVVMCTGGQGEPNAALQRMSAGEHKYVKLGASDTVIISSSPIPGNEVSYDQISNRLKRSGVHLYRHPTHEIDGCGPLHVSGHAKRDELSEMIRIMRPKFFIPVHAGTLRRSYHNELAVNEGVPRKNTYLPENGDSFLLKSDSCTPLKPVPSGSQLVDQNGQVVSSLVVKDRLLLGKEGIFTILLTIDRKSGRLLTSPDIITRGFIHVKENADFMKEIRTEIARAANQRFSRVDLDRFKAELRDHLTHYLFDKTGQSPIIIPVVNTVSGKNGTTPTDPKKPRSSTPRQQTNDREKRFSEMRARLLGRDQLD